ncbi:MAG: SusD family outer membrane lipoprotein NanU [Sphingobacteriales bacterium UTBCD1]|jgi:hypothetical protein|nr:MAG: SusD family outer membrane lipoprotein NanU [Sphingobacteriales bacterium UTBCD1]
MKKYNKIIFLPLCLILLISSCSKKLELSPISSISDASFWKTPEQVDAFVSGIHISFRNHVPSFQLLGEQRADIYGLEPGASQTFTSEATQGFEKFWLQQLDLDNPGVSNFGGFYFNINQLNLQINKLGSIDFVTPANKSYYLGIAYGMRAFYYFQMLRSWGKVVIQTDPVTTIDISNLAKAASTEQEVMTLIKSDINASETNFGSNYTFRNTKSFWSKAATLMLKAEVYLWTSYRGGGNADATIAKTALTDIQANVPSLTLLPSFSDVFRSNNKGNNEIIFASRFLLNEASMNFIQNSFVPQSGFIANFYDSLNNRKFDVTTDNWGGILRSPIMSSTFRKFNDLDSRKWVSIQAAYTRPTPGVYVMAGCFLNKFQGEQSAGSRVMTNDYPIYRYADLLLLLAEAKVILGESPATEINLVRARAFGSNYVAGTMGFPNQAIDTDPKNAILRERLFEFIFEGKRWYDLRRMGDSYVFANTTVLSTEAYKLLWPIDRASLTNNRSLVQTPGYSSF